MRGKILHILFLKKVFFCFLQLLHFGFLDSEKMENDSTMPMKSLSLDENNENLSQNEPGVAGETISRIINTFPRSTLNSENSKPINYSVSIGAAESTEPRGKTSLCTYRKFLVAKFIVNALGKSGYIVDPKQYYVIPKESDFSNELFIVREDKNGQKAVLRIVPGNVTAKLKSLKETKGIADMSAEYFHSLRMQGVKAKSGRPEEVDLSWLTSASNLTTAIVNYEILLKDPSSDIELLTIEHKDAENSGMLFIMYNYSRLVSVLKRFAEAVNNEEYPPLPPLDMIDFEVLTSKDERNLLNSIWEWTRTVERTVNFLDFEVNIAANLKCIKELAVRFTNFYSFTRVLMPAKSHHNFSTMYARIYLLQACLKVFEQFLDLMQIDSNGATIFYPDSINKVV